MTSETKRQTIEVDGEWQDLCAIFTDMVDSDVTLQIQESYKTAVIFGGSAAPSVADSGLLLSHGQTVRGSADHIWVKGAGTVVVHAEG